MKTSCNGLANLWMNTLRRVYFIVAPHACNSRMPWNWTCYKPTFILGKKFPLSVVVAAASLLPRAQQKQSWNLFRPSLPPPWISCRWQRASHRSPTTKPNIPENMWFFFSPSTPPVGFPSLPLPTPRADLLKARERGAVTSWKTALPHSHGGERGGRSSPRCAKCIWWQWQGCAVKIMEVMVQGLVVWYFSPKTEACYFPHQ